MDESPGVTARVTLRLLGGFQARIGTGPALVLPVRKAQALLAYLALPAGRAHPRDKLATLLWGDSPEGPARNSLRQALFALRRVLPAGGVRAEGDAVALDPAAVEVDVAAFERELAEGTPAELAAAAQRYQGDLLAGLSVEGTGGFEEWLLSERERLRELALEALAKLLAHQCHAGQTEAAIQTGLQLLGLDPLQEPVHRTLMRLYLEAGRRGAALRQYQACVAVLARELGVEPEAETKQLYQETVRRREEPSSRRTRRARGAPAPEAMVTETPLIGRDVELATLRKALAEAASGQGRAVVVLGEAGVGKSRLMEELAREARQRGSHVLFGRAYESAQILPFGPWVDGFRTGGLMAEEGLVSGLGPVWRAELARLFPELATPGLPAASDDSLRLFESVARLVGHLAAAQPLVLMLEDLHWADEMSVRLLSFLGRRLPEWPVLVVATAREEDLADAAALRRALGELRGEGHFGEVVLGPLSRPDTARLVRVLSRAGSESTMVARLEEQAWAASEGNPFVVVETVRALREGLSLHEPARLSLPQRVRDVIGRRVERLSERSQQLLSVAAVIGREFDFALLQRASQLSERETAGGVEELVRRRMLHGVDEGFDFTHDRIREVVYGALLPPRRKLLHGDVAAALETLSVGALEPPAAALGLHYRHAEMWAKAVVYLRQAGRQGAARSALPDARVWFEQALGALDKLPESPATVEQAVDIRFDLRPVLSQLGEYGGGLENLRAAGALAAKLKDDRRAGWVAAQTANMYVRFGQFDEARAYLTRALTIARELDDLELRLLATSFLGQARHYQGEYEEQFALITRNVADLPADWIYRSLGIAIPISIFDRTQLVASLAHLGRFAEAARHEAEGIRLAEPIDHPLAVAQPHMVASLFRVLKGDWSEARSLADRAAAALRRGSLAVNLSTSIACSVWARAQLGETSEVLDLLREAEQLVEHWRARQQITRPRGNLLGWDCQALARAWLLLGRLGDAQRLCDMAIESSPPGYAPYALHLAAEIATHPDRLDAERGEAQYRQALALAEPRGMRPLVAHCHLGLGTLYGRVGKREQAREHLVIATTRYREMDMRFWLEQAGAALKDATARAAGP